MKEEKISFESQGKKLVGILHKPDKENPPAVIMVHGFGGEGLEPEFEDIAKNLCKKGYMVLRFIFSSHNTNDLTYLTIEGEINELKDVIDFLENQDIDKNRIAIIAQSLGCSVSLLLNDKRIKNMVLISPGIYLKKVFRKIFEYHNLIEDLEKNGSATMMRYVTGKNKKIGLKFWNEVKKIDHLSEEDIKKVKVPILILYGKNDKNVDYEGVKDLFDFANDPKKLITFDNAEHVFIRDPEKRKTTIKEILDWFKKYL